MDLNHTPPSFDELLTKYKVPLAVFVVGLVLIIAGAISSGLIAKTFVKSTKYPKESLVANQGVIKVDVSGAVKSPGVKALANGARVEDAISAAGGVSEDIDPEYLSKGINLAQKLSDGMKVYLPVKGEKPALLQGVVDGIQSHPGGVINVNQGTASELEGLPGVGAVTAQKIIDNRPYSSIEELYTKKVVNRSVYEKIKNLISTY